MYDDVKPRNIVMIAARDVDHPAVKYELVNRNYLLFGVVTGFIYINWEKVRTDEEWDDVVRNIEQLRIKWVKVVGIKYEDWDIIPPLTKWIKVVGKRADGKLSGMSPFLKTQLITDFFSVHHRGVIHIYVHSYSHSRIV